MNQLILITALSATTGMFGGGKHCGKARHAQAVSACAPVTYSVPATCGAQYAPQGMTYAPAAPSYQAAPTYQNAPRMAPAMPASSAPDTVPAAPSVPPAPPAPPVPPAASDS